MHSQLRRRIELLEKAMPKELPKPRVLSAAEKKQLVRSLHLSCYQSWQHEGLSLEELLALAQFDVEWEHAHPIAHTASGAARGGKRANVFGFWPAVAVREFEIKILERDAKIDAETADALYDNIHAHFF